MTMTRVVPTEFQSEGETIRGAFVVPDGDGPYYGICKFHGMPGSNDQVSGIATELAKAGFLVLTFDFRGFRKSEGRFSLRGEIVDAQNAITHLLESDLSVDDWAGVYGASFGGAVGICTTALDERVKALCVRAPVTDPAELTKSDKLQAAVAWILENTEGVFHGFDDEQYRCQMIDDLVKDAKEYDPMEMVAEVSPRPLYIITGDEDILISVDDVKQLFELAGEPKEMKIIKGADHALSTPTAFEKTTETIVEWFRESTSEFHE